MAALLSFVALGCGSDETSAKPDAATPAEDVAAAPDTAASPDEQTPPGPPCATDQMVNVSGKAVLSRLTIELDPTADIGDAEVLLRDPILAVQGKPATLLDQDCGEATMLTTVDPADPGASAFEFKAVDVSLLTVGLIGSLDDPADSGADKWLRASSGLAAGAPTEDVNGALVFAVTTATVGVIAPLIDDGDEGKYSTAGLVEKGFILGLMLDAEGEPVEGVTLVNQDDEPVEGTAYPNATWDGLDAVTSANGSFVVPSAPLKSYTGRKDGWTFAVQQAASSGGGAFLLTLVGSAD